MKRYVCGLLSGGLLLLVGACDQREERADRAVAIFEAVVEQISPDPVGVSETPPDPAGFAVRGQFATGRTTDPQNAFVASFPGRILIAIEPELPEAARLAPVAVDGAPAPSSPTTVGIPPQLPVSAADTARLLLADAGFSAEVSPHGPSSLLVELNDADNQRERSDQAEFAGDSPLDCSKERVSSLDFTARTACAIAVLQASGHYRDVSWDHRFTPSAADEAAPTSTVRPDPLRPLQWAFSSTSANRTSPLRGIGLGDVALQVDDPAESPVITLIDTGIETGLADFDADTLIEPADFVGGIASRAAGARADRVPKVGTGPCGRDGGAVAAVSHATQIAGLLAAARTGNGSGSAAMVPGLRIQPIRAVGSCGGRLSDISAALEWAAGASAVSFASPEGEADEAVFAPVVNPVRPSVILLSLTAPVACPARLQTAIDTATSRGIIVVAPAGNRGADIAGYAPAGCRNVVTVAGSDGAGRLAEYSNYGLGVDIMAPGGDLAADLDGNEWPDGILVFSDASDCRDVRDRETVERCSHAFVEGTSFSAAITAGALAVLTDAYPNASPAERVEALRSTAVTTSPLQCTGACTGTDEAALIDGQAGRCYRGCGAGLVNLAAARLVLGDAGRIGENGGKDED